MAAHPDPAQHPGTFDTLAGGLHTSPALVTHDGWQSGIQVALSPLGARPLLGLPAGELAGIDVPGSAVIGALAGEVRERLRAAPSWPDRFAVVDEVLTAQLVRRRARGGAVAPGVSPEVGLAWRELLRTGGRARIGGLTRETGWSARHLQGRLRTETGLTPKAAARVIRFDRARRLMLRGGRGPARRAGTGRPGRRVRLLRPGSPGPGVPRAGRVQPQHVAGRGVPKRPSRVRGRAARLVT